MVRYDYSCRKCDFVFELMHGFNDKPQPPCPKCGSPNTFKMISACGIIIHSNKAKAFVMDTARRSAEKREELRQMGIVNITPMKGVTLDQIHSEVKKQGNAVKEQMHAQKEKDEAKRKIKDKAWKIGALKRTPERAMIRKTMKAKEDFAKRSIRI